MAKNTFEKAVDLLVMAPHKHMDYNGNNPHGKPLDNFINLPRVRGAVPLIFAFAIAGSHIDQDNKDNLAFRTFLTGALSLVIANIHLAGERKRSPLNKLYFDTSPDGHRPPPNANTALNLVSEQNEARNDLIFNSTVGVLVSLFVDPVIVAASCTPMFAQDTFRYWRATQVLKGNWSVETELPKKQVQEAKVPANLAMQPT